MKRFFVCTILCIIGAITLAGCGKKDASTTELSVSEGIALLQDMEQGDVSAAEAVIEEARVQLNLEEIEAEKDAQEQAIRDSIPENLSDEEISKLNFKEIFSYCVVMGDSVTHGLEAYGHLTSSEVIFKTGISMESTEEHLNQAAAIKPRRIFLSYGFNDIQHTRNDIQAFRKEFDEFLTRAQETCPDSEIFVNSMFPATAPLTTNRPWYQNVPQCNEMMKEVCAEHNVTYIDNTGIVKSEFYAKDGYHFKSEMYPFWLYSMAKGAGLVK